MQIIHKHNEVHKRNEACSGREKEWGGEKECKAWSIRKISIVITLGGLNG
jgi:hypothetical protein